MKKRRLLFLSVLLMLGLAIKSYGQAPKQFNYQGAARNSNGTPLANKNISIRISILNGSSDGTTQYAEIRNITTNTLGLYSVAIGGPGARSVTGSIEGVTWQSGLKYIKVEVDPNNGSNFSIAGTAQLLSVPYALYAANGPASTPETITTLVDNQNGTYTYKNENATITLINIPASVKNNFQDILSDNTVKNAITQLVNQNAGNVSYDVTNRAFTYRDGNGTMQSVDMSQLIKLNQTLTTITKDAVTSVYTYKNEEGAKVNIDVIGDVKNNFQDIINNPSVKTIVEQLVSNTKGSVSYDATTNEFKYIDQSGKPQVVNIANLVKAAQTVTTITKDPTTSVYTYKNEEGTTVNIDVIGDVKNNFQDIINNPSVKTIVEQLVSNTKGSVSYDATTNEFKYIDQSGKPQVVNIANLVKAAQTVTTITKDPTTSVYCNCI